MFGRALGALIKALRPLESFDMVMGVCQRRGGSFSFSPDALKTSGTRSAEVDADADDPQQPNRPVQEIT